jgi:hypothetical protein
MGDAAQGLSSITGADFGRATFTGDTANASTAVANVKIDGVLDTTGILTGAVHPINVTVTVLRGKSEP